MALTLSRREIGLIYTLLRNTNETLLENSSVDSDLTDSGSLKSTRLNKLIAANLRQKLQSELAAKS